MKTMKTMKTMNKSMMLLMTTFLVAACNPTTPTSLTAVSAVANQPSVQQASVNQSLYNTVAMKKENLIGKWRVMDSAIMGDGGKPLMLEFTEDKVLILNACNMIQANYQIENHQLKIGSAMSTRKACEEALMKADNQAIALLKGQVSLQRFVDALPDAVEMKIDANGQTYRLHKMK